VDEVSNREQLAFISELLSNDHPHLQPCLQTYAQNNKDTSVKALAAKYIIDPSEQESAPSYKLQSLSETQIS